MSRQECAHCRQLASPLLLPPAPVVSWTRTEAGHRAASGQAGQLTADSRDNTLDTPSVLYIHPTLKAVLRRYDQPS